MAGAKSNAALCFRAANRYRDFAVVETLSVSSLQINGIAQLLSQFHVFLVAALQVTYQFNQGLCSLEKHEKFGILKGFFCTWENRKPGILRDFFRIWKNQGILLRFNFQIFK